MRDRQPNLPADLQVEGTEQRIALRVSGSDKVPFLIDPGIGEPGVNVENGHQSQLVGRLKLAPDQEPVGSIEGQQGTRIWLDHGDSVVAKKLIEVIEVAICFRSNIGCVHGVPLKLVLSLQLELAVKTMAIARKR